MQRRGKTGRLSTRNVLFFWNYALFLIVPKFLERRKVAIRIFPDHFHFRESRVGACRIAQELVSVAKLKLRKNEIYGERRRQKSMVDNLLKLAKGHLWLIVLQIG